jgi:hypothetical protein
MCGAPTTRARIAKSGKEPTGGAGVFGNQQIRSRRHNWHHTSPFVAAPLESSPAHAVCARGCAVTIGVTKLQERAVAPFNLTFYGLQKTRAGV